MMAKFFLEAPFKPTGDQPEAIAKIVESIKKGNRFQTLLGATGTGKTFVDSCIIAQIGKPTLVIAHNKTLAAQLYNEFKNFFPKNAVCYFVSYYDYYQPEAYIPETDTYIEKDADINAEIDHLRHQATYALQTREDVIIVASVSCIYNLGSPAEYKKQVLEFWQGEEIKMVEVLRRLTGLQYVRNDYELLRGRFRVKGDRIEIFPQYEENLIRLEFFGDTIERILKIDPLSGQVLEELAEIKIWPAKHFLIPAQTMPEILANIRSDLEKEVAEFKQAGKILEAERLKMRVEADLEMLELTGTVAGIENYSRYFDGRLPGVAPLTLIDYFPKDFLMIIDESHMTIPQLAAMYNGDWSRKEALVKYGFRLKAAFDNRPLSFSEFERKISQVIFQSATPGEYELRKSKEVVELIIRPTGIVDPQVEVRPTKNQIDDLLGEVQKALAKKQRVLITTLTKRTAEELTEYLKNLKIKAEYLHSDIETLKRTDILRDLRLGKIEVVVGINLLREGLDLPEVGLIIILDADKEGFLRSTTSLIQTIGRAARNVEGRVIMYADRITRSMAEAIKETNRRRRIQEEYNRKHNIKPKSAARKIEERISVEIPEEPVIKEAVVLSPERKEFLIKELKAKMELAALNLEFEKAALYRDEIKRLSRLSSK